MALQFVLEKLDGLDESVQAMYGKREDGKFYLQVAGLDDHYESKESVNGLKTALEKTREEAKEAKAYAKQFEGVNLEELKETKELQRKLAEKELIEAGKFEEAIAQRLQEANASHEAQMKKAQEVHFSLTEELNKVKDKLSHEIIVNKALDSVNKLGVLQKGAQDDIIHRAKTTWSLDDNGNPTAKGFDGVPMYGSQGNPLTMDEWAKTHILEKLPYLFLETKGGGASTVKGSNGKTFVTPDGYADMRPEARLNHARRMGA